MTVNKKKSAETTAKHPVSEYAEFISDLYFDMLCVVARNDKSNENEKRRYIQNLMDFCKETLPIDEYYKRAMIINDERMNEFIVQCKKHSLCELFLIDAVLLVCVNGKPCEKDIEFIIEFSDAFGMAKNVDRILKLALIILNNDLRGLEIFARRGKNVSGLLKAAEYYVQPIIDDNIFTDDKNLCYYSLQRENRILFSENKTFRDLNSVTINNQIMNKKISFISVKTVRICNCDISDYTEESVLWFENVEKVIIENCKIKNCNTHRASRGTVFIQNASEITITGTGFENCGNRETDGAAMLFYGSSFTKVYIKNCTFQSLSSWIGGAISAGNDSKVIIVESSFKNCNARHIGAVCYSGSSENVIKTKNCEFEECHAEQLFFGQHRYYDEGSSFSSCSPVRDYS